MLVIRPQPIGGYFELELAKTKQYPHQQNSIKFQSGRAAFSALLDECQPQRVWMPRFICDAMLHPLIETGIDVVWYDLDFDLNPVGYIDLASEDLILYVNYFGVCQKNIESILQRFPMNQIVLDYSQAFYDKPHDVLATIYSPRKFFGIPDGGLLISTTNVPQPNIQDCDSIHRVSYLLRRLFEEPETGYMAFQEAEESLEDFSPKQLSSLTERIMNSIDFETVKSKRCENFLFLHEKLASENQFSFNLDHIVAPLCYPFHTKKRGVRDLLIANRIFVPTYWGDALARVSKGWAEEMVYNCIPLPIDQRYCYGDMERILSVILS